jgi:hypothetical protein
MNTQVPYFQCSIWRRPTAQYSSFKRRRQVLTVWCPGFIKDLTDKQKNRPYNNMAHQQMSIHTIYYKDRVCGVLILTIWAIPRFVIMYLAWIKPYNISAACSIRSLWFGLSSSSSSEKHYQHTSEYGIAQLTTCQM